MTTHKLNGKTILWVEVPDSYEHRVIDYNALIGVFKDKDGATKKIYIDVPKKSEFLSLSKDMTEEVAKEIMPTEKERHPDMNLYINYTEESTRYAYLLKSALEAFRSLQQSLNIDPKKNYAILIEDTQI